MTGFGLGAVLWQMRSNDTVPAVVIARTVKRGDTVTASDLRVEYLGRAAGLTRVAPARSEALVGRVARVDLRPGTLVTPSQVSGSVALDQGGGVVGLSLRPGQYPSTGLAPGDRVNVVLGAGESAASTKEPLLARRTQVFTIDDLGEGQLLVSVRASEKAANRIAAASGNDRLCLVLVPT